MPQLDENEYASLLREHHAKLWTVASAIVGDRNLAEDVVQDAAITGLRRLADFEPGTSFSAWMSQIVRYTALNQLRVKKKRKVLSLATHLEKEAPPQRGAENSAVTPTGDLTKDQQVFDDQVASAIANLDADRRACLLLRVVQGLSYDEIAEAVGLSAGTAMSHVHRAKASLRVALAGSPQESADSGKSREDG